MAKRRPSGDGMVRKREDGRWEGRIVVGHKNNGDPIFQHTYARTQKELTDMTNGIIAEAFEMDRDDLKRRRAQSVRNVKATNGLISLEKYARSRQEPDWDDDEWQD